MLVGIFQVKGSIRRQARAFIIGAYLYTRHLQWLQRPYLERAASEFLAVAKQAIVGFVEFADKIQASGSWKTVASNWEAYCKLTWGFSASNLSHLRGAAPYAKAILEAGYTQIPLKEGHIRKFRKHVPLESPLVGQTFVLGAAVAKELKQAPSAAVYRRSYEVLQTVQDTGGVVQVGEQVFFVRDEASAVSAVKAVLAEVKRLALDENNKKKPFEIRAFRKGNLWEFETDAELPDFITFKLFL